MTKQYSSGVRVFQKALKFFFVVAVVVIAYGLGVSDGQYNNPTPEAIGNVAVTNSAGLPDAAQSFAQNSASVDFGLFWHTWNIVKEKYVGRDDLDAQQMIYGAIKGMLASTNDPYTTFFDPEDMADFTEGMTGKFEGIGAEIGIRENILRVISPLAGMPAEQSGLRAGDMILKIDGATTADMDINEAVANIRGTAGTTVVLSIFRSGDDEAQDITIVRGNIVIASVTNEYIDGGIGYIRINRFGDDTTNEFRRQAQQLLAGRGSIQKLIIDLRNNPGGYLDGAVEIGSMTLPARVPVVREIDADKQEIVLATTAGDFLSHLPTVILINEGSASASEIVTGALRDNRDNVTIVGEKSYGKGSVQELIPLDNDKAVKVTVAEWFTPNGDHINGEGIAPTIEIELTREDFENDRDPQKDKAIEILRNL